MSVVRVVLAAPCGPDLAGVDEPRGDDPGMEPLLAHVRAAGAPAPVAAASTAVVIDVLRATTTLTVALAAGAASVHTAATVAEARAMGESLPGALLCGERHGRVIPGFDLGNSPFEYTRTRVAGKALVFASTNGSQALRLAAAARRLFVGAFVNASAVAARVAAESDVTLVASGKLGEPAIEDVACAGWIARALLDRGFTAGGPEVAAAVALAPRDAGGVRALVEGSSHAGMLEAIGPSFVRDVEYCGSLDAIDGAFSVGAATSRS